MKKMLQIVGILIVMSTTYAINATAQQTRPWREGDGSGMFYTSIQNQQDPGLVQENFYGAMFGSDAESFRIYRNLDNFHAEDIRAVTEKEMSRQLGSRFDRTDSRRYKVTYEYYKLGGVYDDRIGTTTYDANELWRTYEDGYIYDSSSDHDIHYGNPLTFATYRNNPDRAGKIWMIAVIKDTQTGNTVRLRANCGNVLRPKGSSYEPRAEERPKYRERREEEPREEYRRERQPDCKIVAFYANPTSTKKRKPVILTWNTTCESVTIGPINGANQTFAGVGQVTVYLEESTIFTLTTNTGLTANASVGVKGGSFFKTAAIVVGSAAVLVGGYYGIKALTKGSKQPPPARTGPEQGPSGSYPNNWDQNNPPPQPNPGDPYTY